MYLPHSYEAALLFMIGSMLCWGSWANAMKLCPGYRFQLFYWDYLIGLLVGVILLGLSLGSAGSVGAPFLADLQHAPSAAIAYAIAGGIVFNIANLLLVAAIEVAGMAVAFPVGIGLALVIGALSSYLLAPQGNPLLLFGGIFLVVVAIVCDALAYREREIEHRKGNARGIVLSLLAGALMGTFYPLVSKAMALPAAPGPYATAFFFVIGVILCALPLNYFFMRKPIDGGTPVTIAGFTGASARWHLAGILGGAIWVCGGTLNFVASRLHFVGPAVSYSIGQGATMISALWGVFIWREFRSPSPRVLRLLVVMFLAFLAGLTAIAIAPIF
jgi:glucose uptake protein